MRVKRVLIEASKLTQGHHDGCYRYVTELLRGMLERIDNGHTAWQVEVYFDGKTQTISEARDLIWADEGRSWIRASCRWILDCTVRRRTALVASLQRIFPS